jgi:uncharacterized repeat protein (TIGR03803 family)
MYGLTIDGGSSNAGTAFRVTTNGILTTLAEFHGPDGANPTDRVIQVEDGSFYGTTQHGGDYGMGTVFRVTTNGVLTSLVSFDSTNGALPDAGLVQGDDGNLYGETLAGGTSDMGTIFRVTTNGLLTKLAEFDYSNGAGPERGLVLGNDRSFYGIALRGGIQGPASPESSYGTVFKVTTNGILTTIVKFNGSNGANPGSPLVLGPDGRFYGTTFRGGPNSGGTIFRLAIAEFTSIDVQTGGAVMLNGTGPFNQAFSLWFTTDLALPYSSWTLLTRGAFNTNGHFSYSDKGASASVSRFYRLSSP